MSKLLGASPRRWPTRRLAGTRADPGQTRGRPGAERAQKGARPHSLDGVRAQGHGGIGNRPQAASATGPPDATAAPLGLGGPRPGKYRGPDDAPCEPLQPDSRWPAIGTFDLLRRSTNFTPSVSFGNVATTLRVVMRAAWHLARDRTTFSERSQRRGGRPSRRPASRRAIELWPTNRAAKTKPRR